MEGFDSKLTEILNKAEKDAEENTSVYSGPFERAVIRRLQKYQDNYFAWVRDFAIPTTDNLRGLCKKELLTNPHINDMVTS